MTAAAHGFAFVEQDGVTATAHCACGATFVSPSVHAAQELLRGHVEFHGSAGGRTSGGSGPRADGALPDGSGRSPLIPGKQAAADHWAGQALLAEKQRAGTVAGPGAP